MFGTCSMRGVMRMNHSTHPY